ncbi:hypothetical protein [Brucella sp. 2280]|uniref:hypothetical protein n=1 Tax=Brucella sp. 2280 TaxID=2592625 RepID=UPI001295F7DD|nr:hypothetical protein [Brucella sp. 2280]QGA55907.1 hypothetical protein GHC20_01905 [Brucella sp. 2280]
MASELTLEQIISRVMRDHIGPEHNQPIGEGGAPRIDWYALQAELLSAISAWNTRPAPAATDTGLVTVAWQRHSSFYADGWGPVDAGHAQKLAAAGEPVRELVTRSQAEELLAAERAKADEYYGEAVASYDRKLRIEALEAKLAAAEKALEPFAEACTITNHEDARDIDDSLAATKITFGDLRKARAVLEGKPS